MATKGKAGKAEKAKPARRHGKAAKAGKGGKGPSGRPVRGKPGRHAKPARPGFGRGKKAALASKAGAPALAAVPSQPAAPARPDPAKPLALALAKAALDKKAEDVTLLDVRGLTSYADWFVILTADSDRQAAAIADHLELTMKQQGHTKVGAEGYETGRWILVDYGDVVAHVMNRESREFYDLEGLWADAPRERVEG
jgi:ribosome-associated protein